MRKRAAQLDLARGTVRDRLRAAARASGELASTQIVAKPSAAENGAFPRAVVVVWRQQRGGRRVPFAAAVASDVLPDPIPDDARLLDLAEGRALRRAFPQLARGIVAGEFDPE